MTCLRSTRRGAALARWRWAGLLLVAAALAGCRPAGPARYEVAGDVTWEGVPVERGDIIFTPRDKHTRAEAGKIVAGRYHLLIEAGPKNVQVFATRTVPGKVDAVMNSPLVEMYIPAEFNVQTTLTTDVAARNDNRADFHLPSPGPR